MRQLAAFSTSLFGREDRSYPKNDQGNGIKWIKIYGLRWGINTEDNGFNYATLINNGGNKELHIYRDIGLGIEYAQAIGTGLGVETVDIVPVGSSGLSGRVRFEYPGSDDTDIWIVHRWNVPGLAKNIDLEAGEPELTDDYTAFMAGLETLARSLGSDLLSKSAIVRDQVTTGLIAGAIAEFIKSANKLSGNVITAIPDTVGGGLAWEYSGIIKDLADAMVADDHYFTPNIVANSVPTFPAAQAGQYDFTITPKQYVEDADVFRVECISTLASTQKETFRIGSNNRGQESNILTIGQDFDSRQLGLAIRMERDMLLAGAGSAYLTNPTITGESSDYVDMGSKKLYGTLTKNGTERRIRMYRQIDKLEADLVADSGIVIDVEPFTIQVTSAKNSGINMTYLIDASLALDGDYDFEVQLNIANPGEYWEFETSNNMAGIWIILFGRIYLYDGFPTTGSTQIDESLIRIWDETLNGYWL
jgi:hypothetical protein